MSAAALSLSLCPLLVSPGPGHGHPHCGWMGIRKFKLNLADVLAAHFVTCPPVARPQFEVFFSVLLVELYLVSPAVVVRVFHVASEPGASPRRDRRGVCLYIFIYL